MKRHINLYEAIKDVIPTFPFTLVDYCCGDASFGALFNNHPSVQKIIFVDIKKVRNLERETNVLQTPFQLFLEDLEFHSPPSNSLVVALHACGTLTDRVIEKAVFTKNPFIVMPCCYRRRMDSLKPLSPHTLPVSYSRRDYYDARRLQYAKERGYLTQIRLIDRKITPMNHILIGFPQL